MRKASFSAIFATFIICFAFWILVTWSLDYEELIAGAIVGIFAAICSAKYFVNREDASHILHPANFFCLIAYCFGVFLWELTKANVDMAIRAFGPRRLVKPGIVKVPVHVHTKYSQSMLANSITLTPGTITMELAEEDGKDYFYIHCINSPAEGGEATGEAIKGKMEKWVRRIWK